MARHQCSGGMIMKNKIKIIPLLISLALPLAVGGLSALLTGSSMMMYDSFVKPPLSPPGWAFPVVWTILYILMGLASYLVYTSGASTVRIQRSLSFYAVQLALNFFWPLTFFRLRMYLTAFLWLVALWVLVLICTVLFRHIRKPAGQLFLPYLIWCSFALYLNLFVYLLN